MNVPVTLARMVVTAITFKTVTVARAQEDGPVPTVNKVSNDILIPF